MRHKVDLATSARPYFKNGTADISILLYFALKLWMTEPEKLGGRKITSMSWASIVQIKVNIVACAILWNLSLWSTMLFRKSFFLFSCEFDWVSLVFFHNLIKSVIKRFFLVKCKSWTVRNWTLKPPKQAPTSRMIVWRVFSKFTLLV